VVVVVDLETVQVLLILLGMEQQEVQVVGLQWVIVGLSKLVGLEQQIKAIKVEQA
jgi:hypothetical protein